MDTNTQKENNIYVAPTMQLNKIYVIKSAYKGTYAQFILPEKREIEDGDSRIHYQLISQDMTLNDQEWWLLARYELYESE
jgi:hypothetical protein